MEGDRGAVAWENRGERGTGVGWRKDRKRDFQSGGNREKRRKFCNNV